MLNYVYKTADVGYTSESTYKTMLFTNQINLHQLMLRASRKPREGGKERA